MKKRMWKKGEIGTLAAIVAAFLILSAGALLVSEFSKMEFGGITGMIVGSGTPSDPYNITDCTELNTSGYYILNNSISATGTCLDIKNDSINLDCRGYNINGTGTGNGINISRYDNITIKNCGIYNFTRGISSESSFNRFYFSFINNTIKNNSNFGILLAGNGGIYNSSFIDNIIEHQGSYGIIIPSLADTIIFKNNNIKYNHGGISFPVAGINNSNFEFNNISNNNLYGVSISVDFYNISFISNIISYTTAGYGLYLLYGSNLYIINNTINNNNEEGIYAASSEGYNNSIISNNTINNNNEEGISLYGGSNFTIQNNIVDNNSQTGIYFIDSINYSVFDFNNITNNGGSGGIYISNGASDTNLTSNIINNNSNYGIYLNSSYNNILTSNNASYNSQVGIYLFFSSNNTLTSNTANNNTYYGILISSNSKNNTLTSNTANNNNHGISLSSSSNNTLTSNTANNNNHNGIYLISGSNNNNLTSNTANSNSDYGIYLFSSSNYNTLTNNTAEYNNQHGVYLPLGSNNNNLTNTYACFNNQSGGYYDIKDAGAANTFSETTCDTSSPSGLCDYSCTPQPIATEFDISYGSTNFSAVPDITNVTNLTLATQYGKIQFPSDYGIDAGGEDYDANINIGAGFISVNTNALDSTFNASANLTINNINCPATIYYGNGFYTSAQQIINEANICTATTDPNCTNINCAASTLTFAVSHFTGFGAEGAAPPAPPAPEAAPSAGRARSSICIANWNCSDWGPCLPNGTQYRECLDLNRCDESYTQQIALGIERAVKPEEAQTCTYVSICADGMLNGDESDVDCGGSCSKCGDGKICRTDQDCADKCNLTTTRCYSPPPPAPPEVTAPEPAPPGPAVEEPYVSRLIPTLIFAGAVIILLTLVILTYRYKKETAQREKEMHAQRLNNFFAQSLKKGYTREQIKDALINQGWSEDSIKEHSSNFFEK